MASSLTQIALAVSAGAATAVALMTVFAATPLQHWTATTNSRAIQTAPVRSLKLGGSLPAHAEMPSGQPMVLESLTETPVQASSIKVPALFAVSGILFLIAGALRYFKPQGEEYAMLAVSSAQAERLRRLQEEERMVQERRLRLAREEAARRAGVQIPSTPIRAAPQPVAAIQSSLEAEWKLRQQERERREREKEAAKQREIQERLARLSKLSSGSYQTVATAPVAAPTVSEWERRQQEREFREKQLADAKQREIQERLARLAKLTGQAVPTSPVSAPVSPRAAAPTSPRAAVPTSPRAAAPASPSFGSNEWELRQQQRERMEREKQERAQREIQERLARLAKLGSTPQVQPVVHSPAAGNSELERLRIQREQRERREREAAEAKKREIQERLHRLQRLSAQSAAAPVYASKY